MSQEPTLYSPTYEAERPRRAAARTRAIMRARIPSDETAREARGDWSTKGFEKQVLLWSVASRECIMQNGMPLRRLELVRQAGACHRGEVCLADAATPTTARTQSRPPSPP